MEDAMGISTFATFFLNEQLFGLDILLIREINKHLDISPVPHAPDYISGLINLRGQIVTLIDLKHRLGLGPCEINEDTHNIIIKTEAELQELSKREQIADQVAILDKVGLLVGKIGDVVSVSREEIEDPPANLGKLDGKYISGVVKLEKELMAILSPAQILSE
jgi:purine-binding chemotaxis protein CheW